MIKVAVLNRAVLFVVGFYAVFGAQFICQRNLFQLLFSIDAIFNFYFMSIVLDYYII